jgi:hypothetical protein
MNNKKKTHLDQFLTETIITETKTVGECDVAAQQEYPHLQTMSYSLINDDTKASHDNILDGAQFSQKMQHNYRAWISAPHILACESLLSKDENTC